MSFHRVREVVVRDYLVSCGPRMLKDQVEAYIRTSVREGWHQDVIQYQESSSITIVEVEMTEVGS